MNSPFGPTVSRSALNSGWMKYFTSISMDSVICPSRTGSSDTCLRTLATLMRIIVSEWPCACSVGSYFDGIHFPGFAVNLRMRLKRSIAFFAHALSPDASAYSAYAIAAKHSEKT